MPQVDIVYIIYAALLILGGIMGFLKGKSLPSLISGSATGVFALLIAWISTKEPKIGLMLGLLLSFALGIFFTGRYQITRKPMPALVMSVASFVVSFASIVFLLIHRS